MEHKGLKYNWEINWVCFVSLRLLLIFNFLYLVAVMGWLEGFGFVLR